MQKTPLLKGVSKGLQRFGAQAGFDRIIQWKMLLTVISEGRCQHSPAGTPPAPSSAQLASPTDLPFTPAPSTERKSVIKVSFLPMLYVGGRFFSLVMTAEQGRTLHWHNFRVCTGGRRETTSPRQQSCCSGESSRHLFHSGQMAKQGQGQFNCAPRQQSSLCGAAVPALKGNTKTPSHSCKPLKPLSQGILNLEFSCY